MASFIEHLRTSVAAYPASATSRRRSRVIENGRSIEVAFKFNSTNLDRIDALLVEFVANRVGSTKCKPSDGKDATVCYRCNATQAREFGRYLAYASTLPMAVSPPLIDHARTPLPVLLTRALIAFTREYEQSPPNNGLPSLAVWSNILQAVPKSGIEVKEFEKSAVLAKRVAKVVVRHASDHGLVNVEKPPAKRSKPVVKLTEEGERLRKVGANRVKKVETAWHANFGKHFERLRTSLDAITKSLELEYPNYITGYGAADESLTGGSYLPAEEGPPRIPARGEEWPVVERDLRKAPKAKNLTAQLSQTLMQFALDYEAEDLGRLGLTTMFFQYLPDEGMRLGDARRHYAITGNGKSLHERHMYVVLEPGKSSDSKRGVFPTQKTRRARDAYPYLVAAIETRWEERYGRPLMTNLRKSLEAMTTTNSEELPEYPDTTAWMHPWSGPYVLNP